MGNNNYDKTIGLYLARKNFDGRTARIRTYACAYVHIIYIPVLFETRIYVSTCCPSLLSTARSKGPRICVRSTHTPACTWDSRFLKARRVLAREDDAEGGEGWKEERGEGQRWEAHTAYKKKETRKGETKDGRERQRRMGRTKRRLPKR